MAGGRRFELQRQLGEGSFGTVFLADMVSLGGFRKTVALKVLAQRWSTESDAARRLRDEARLLGRLEHRNIVRVYDLVRVDGRWAVVMEAVRGADLERVVHAAGATGSPAPLRAALEGVCAIAAALDAALNGSHGLAGELRVVHRDIKPSNVILTAEGEIKVLDFGIARADLDEREAKTSSIGFGSIPYMGPERLRGEEATSAGDVYSLGAVLYELLVGMPYGRAELGPDKARAQWEERRRLLEGAVGGGPLAEATVALIGEAMAWDPELRPDIIQVRARLDTMVRAAEGEGLTDWARRVVPVTLARVMSGEQPVGGVLSEEESGGGEGPRSSGDRLAVGGSSAGHSSAGHSSAGRSSAGRSSAGSGAGVPHAPTLVATDLDVAAPTVGQTHHLPASPTVTMEEPEPVPAAPRPQRWPAAAGLLLVIVAVGGWWLYPEAAQPAGSPADAQAQVEVAPKSPAVSVPAVPVEIAPQVPADASPPEPEAQALAQRAPDPPALGAQDKPTPQARASTAGASTAGASTARTGSSSAATSPGSTEAPPAPSAGASTSAAEPDSPAPASTVVRMVKVVVAGASRVEARCGARTGSGTTSLVVRDLPAGPCQVTAEVDGQTLTGALNATGSHAFSCAAAGGALECR